jgi:hypothetical protein
MLSVGVLVPDVPKQGPFFLCQESVSLLLSITTQKILLLKKVINFAETIEMRNLGKLLHQIKCIWENQTKKMAERVEEEKESYCKRK